MPDPILTPEQVEQWAGWCYGGEDDYYVGDHCKWVNALADSHESLRELAGRLARALKASHLLALHMEECAFNEIGIEVMNAPPCDCGFDAAHAEALALLADPAVQSLIAASKEAADGN